MKIVIRREPLSSILRWTERLLFVAAIVSLGYCGFVAVDAWRFQKTEARAFERLIVHEVPGVSPAANTVPIAANNLIGRMEISRLGLSTLVVEGTSSTDLRRAVGHIAGTALPGQS
ncbi:MAG: hypothetical protein ABI823_16320, partial [Bryobacteraceae bacterium]